MHVVDWVLTFLLELVLHAGSQKWVPTFPRWCVWYYQLHHDPLLFPLHMASRKTRRKLECESEIRNLDTFPPIFLERKKHVKFTPNYNKPP